MAEIKRATRPITRRCEFKPARNPCNNSPVWQIQHVEYSNHLEPRFSCGQHLNQMCLEAEYQEGDEMYVKRVKFDC